MYDNDTKMTLKEACEWVKSIFNIEITSSSISYLVQYGQIRKINGNGEIKVYKNDLYNYYITYINRERDWKKALGDELDWHLSFENVKESERTKHVHRLHPYKGKFIPQLVDYFLNSNIDEFKKRVFFQKEDIILDPFCGSGTSLVQANELGIHAIGIDVSEFNSLICNVKVNKHDLIDLQREVRGITLALRNYISENGCRDFEEELNLELSKFNKRFFPSPDFAYKVRKGEIDQKDYTRTKELDFLRTFERLVKKYGIHLVQEGDQINFLDKWYNWPVRNEIDFVMSQVGKIKNENTKDTIKVILSRTVRSCRATTHSDLATLLEPIHTTYYCHKHYKICKPLFSIIGWWDFYSRDTLKRLSEFNRLRTDTFQLCLTGDSQNIDIYKELEKQKPDFADLLRSKKIKGIFTSPPYVGMIDYHEQHAYAYELFKLQRRDNLEIGPLFKGKNSESRVSYINGISNVLINCKKYLANNYDVFIVANDNYNLYPEIAQKSNMRIVEEFRRPVLNRTEKDKSIYSEKIFHLQENNNGVV